MRTVRPFVLALLSLALLAPAAALADGVWRLAGTFNGWNTRDDAWAMKPAGENPDVHVIEKALEPGSYRFKFVRGGDWSVAHFGSDQAPGRLAQPGDDILLTVRFDAVYRITLNTRDKVWTNAVSKVDRPMIVARILGQPRVDRDFVLDLGESVTPSGGDFLSFTVTSGNEDLRMFPVEGRTNATRIAPRRSGPLELIITLRDGQQTAQERVEVRVLPRFTCVTLRLPTEHPERHFFEPQADGVERLLISVPVQTLYTVIEVFRDTARVAFEQDADLAAGTFVIEAHDAGVVEHTIGGRRTIFKPGNWRRVTLTPPTTTDRVFLVGDFNAWAGAGQPGAIELLSRVDGSYSAIVNLPEGTHRYQFELDAGVRLPDPGAGEQETMPDGRRVSVMTVGPRPRDLGQARQNNINRAAVRHDPATLRDFAPIHRGLGLADISVRALPGDVQRAFATVRARDEGGGERVLRVPMSRTTDSGGFDRFGARVMTGMPEASYTVTLIDGTDSVTTPAHRVAIDPDPAMPEWAMGAVWYQVFPERFRNGNPLNDPHGPGVYLKPWTDDWYTVSASEAAAWRERYGAAPGEAFPPRQGGDLFHVVWDRRYGGDLQGIQEKFGYLRDLGVTGLYMNPIFEAESMHKYDATDFRHIDDNFSWPASAGRVPESWSFPDEPANASSWTWTPGDRYFVEKFLPSAREHGIRVVLDGVFNHTGLPFWAFRDIQEKGIDSEYKDWFFVTFDEDGRLATWESWFNTGALPKFRQTAEGDLVEPVKEHIFAITRRWMDPNGDGDPSDGIDGWRLDVALDIGMPFWRDWRELVKSINPDAVIIAEIWNDATPFLRGDSFDTQMHYPFAHAVTDWLGVRPGMTSTQLAQRLAAAFEDDYPQTRLVHQNLFGSHDTDRYVSMLQNPNRGYDQGNRPQDHDYPYNDTRPSAETYKRSLLGVAIQATYTGAPMVYYGDEVGMWGADDPTDRKPFPWPDKGQMQNPDERADFTLRDEYARWLNLRRDPTVGPVLRFGSTRHIETGDDHVFAFDRALNGTRVVVVVNRQPRAWNASGLLPSGTGGTRVDAESARSWVFEEREEVAVP